MKFYKRNSKKGHFQRQNVHSNLDKMHNVYSSIYGRPPQRSRNMLY